MNKKKLTKKELDFCRHYVRLRNPKEASLRSGFTLLPEYRGIAMLSRKEIKDRITQLEKECSADKNLVCAGLQRLAFGSVCGICIDTYLYKMHKCTLGKCIFSSKMILAKKVEIRYNLSYYVHSV